MDTTKPVPGPSPLYKEDPDSNTITVLRDPETDTEVEVLSALESLNFLHEINTDEGIEARAKFKTVIIVCTVLTAVLVIASAFELMAIFGGAL